MRAIEVAAVAVTSLLLLSPGPASATPLPPPEIPVVGAAAAATSPAAENEAPAAPAAIATKPAEPPKPPVPSLIANINLTTQTMTVVVHGKAVHSWKVSSGAAGYATPVGTFKPDWMAKIWYSKQYDDAPMPHAVFFKGGAAIHATTSIGRLGTAASHGCVRLAPANAEAFYKLVSRHGLAVTRVAVSGRAPVREERREDRIARRDNRSVSPVRSQQTMPVQPVWISNRPLAYPGDRHAYNYPAGSIQANRTPYWARQ